MLLVRIGAVVHQAGPDVLGATLPDKDHVALAQPGPEPKQVQAGEVIVARASRQVDQGSAAGSSPQRLTTATGSSTQPVAGVLDRSSATIRRPQETGTDC